MKVLLTGILPASAPLMAERFGKDGFHVSILGQLPQGVENDAPGVAFHEMNPGNADALRILEANSFDVVVFFYAFQCEDKREYGSVQGTMLDTLFAMQHTAQSSGATSFILVTDRRVFGLNQTCAETEQPLPDTPTGMLIKAAEDCLTCCDHGSMRILILRVTSLYSFHNPNSFFAFVLQSAKDRVPLLLHGSRKTPCDFLHTDDLALFLSMAMELGFTGVYHLAYGARRTYGDLEDALHACLPDLHVEYTGYAGISHTLSSDAAQRADWVPRHDFIAEMPELAKVPLEKKRLPWRVQLVRLRRKINKKLLPWLDLVLLAVFAEGLSRLGSMNMSFRYVDYWMLYVALLGYMHGSTLGVISALVACVTYALDWIQAGHDLYLLLYNFDNWIPMVTYLLAGSVFGYISDRRRAKEAQLVRERDERTEEKNLLQSMYQQTSADRNLLQEQVLNYRDSYGRIYQITRKLDTMQPEQIFLSTLDVLEDIMQNHSVALYANKAGSSFARLVVHSRAYPNLARSLDLEKLPRLREALEAGKLFANTSLEAGYPTFAAPVVDHSGLVAAIMLWEVPFEQQTLYQQNLLSVITGLVQSAMVRAIHYANSSADMYLRDTHILANDAFRATLTVYQKMRKQRTASYLLVHVDSDAPLEPTEMDAKLGRVIRSTDVAGYLEGHGYYLLFPQAGTENLPQISSRLHIQGLTCTVISQEVAYA